MIYGYENKSVAEVLKELQVDAVIEINCFDMTFESRKWGLLRVKQRNYPSVADAAQAVFKFFLDMTGKDSNDFLLLNKEPGHYTIIPKYDREMA